MAQGRSPLCEGARKRGSRLCGPRGPVPAAQLSVRSEKVAIGHAEVTHMAAFQ